MSRRPTRRRVLFCIPGLTQAGPDRVFLNLLNALDRDRFETMLAVGDIGGALLQDLDPAIRRVQVGQPGRKYPILSLARAVRDLRPDTVVATLRMNFTVLAAKPLFPSRTRVVVRQATPVSHNLEELRQLNLVKGTAIAWTYRILFRRADLVICQSSAMRADIQATLGLTGRRLASVPNPVDVEQVGVLAHEVTVMPPRVGTTLVTVGRLTRAKGYDVLVDALVELLPSHPDLHWWAVGDGEERARLEGLVQTRGLQDRVLFLGFQPNPLPFVRTADLFVAPSRYEGFSNALLEALACGTPAVATTGAGAGDEAIEEERNGWLADPGDLSSLVATLDRALPRVRSMNRSAIRRDCAERFSLRRVAALYEELL